jgi:cytochrome P450
MAGLSFVEAGIVPATAMHALVDAMSNTTRLGVNNISEERPMHQPALPLPSPTRRRAPWSSSPLAALPGSDRLDELYHLIRDPTAFLHTRFARYGRLFKTRFVIPAVFAVGEEANRTMLVTRTPDFSEGRGYARTPVRWVFRGSIMLQDGDEHAHTRALLSPAVGRLAIHESAAQVQHIWERCAAALRPDRVEDVYLLSERTTFAVAANVLVGLTLGSETDAFRPLFEDVIGGMMVQVPLRVPFGRLDRSLKARAALVRLLGPHIERARRRPPVGLVGQLAHHRDPAGQPLSIEEIVGHLTMLAWAGYDTTASTSAWILHLLAERPALQARLRAELAVAGNDPAALATAAGVPAVETFLLEVERMYPSALFFPRVTTQPISLLGHSLPKDTLVFYSPYLSHRDPETFDNPHVFDPDRWSRAERRPSPARLVGFGGGVRVCLGKAFAKLQLRLLIGALLRHHRIEPDPLARPRIQGLPVHHPVGARVRFVPLTE